MSANPITSRGDDASRLVAWAGAGAVIAADFRFTSALTVGSIVLAALVVVLGGAFTLRSNVRSFWRGLAEERAEQIVFLNAQLAERDQRLRDLTEQDAADRAKFSEEQSKIRHELKNEIAAATALLAVEKQKTDLTSLLELLAKQHGEAMAKQDTILRALVAAPTGSIQSAPATSEDR